MTLRHLATAIAIAFVATATAAGTAQARRHPTHEKPKPPPVYFDWRGIDGFVTVAQPAALPQKRFGKRKARKRVAKAYRSRARHVAHARPAARRAAVRQFRPSATAIALPSLRPLPPPSEAGEAVSADRPWTIQEIVAGVFEPQAVVRAVRVPDRKLPVAALPTIGSLTKSFADGISGLFEGFRQFLVATATAGGTMTRQGKDVAIGRLHPEFARRLAAAIEEARGSGLPNAGCFSAYRPPGFGVGGYRDKFQSMHAYGLACDMTGIGWAGSAQAKLWHKIANRHGIYGPYGPNNRREFNHMQPTMVRGVNKNSPLRKTITARGPKDVAEMWKLGEKLLDRYSSVLEKFPKNSFIASR